MSSRATGGVMSSRLRSLDIRRSEPEHEPQPDEHRHRQHDRDRDDRAVEDEVGDEQDDAVHRHRERDEPGEREPARHLDEARLVAAAEHHAVIGGRRDEERRRDRGRQQRAEVHVLLELGHLREALLERDREQEREEDLHARHRDAQLLQELVELAVEALVLGLVGRCLRGHGVT